MTTQFLVLHTHRSGGMVISDALHSLGLMAPVSESALNLGYGPGLLDVFRERIDSLDVKDKDAWGYRLSYEYLRHLYLILGEEKVQVILDHFTHSILVQRDDLTVQAVSSWMCLKTGIHTRDDMLKKDPAVTSEELEALFTPTAIDDRLSDLTFGTKLLDSVASQNFDVHSVVLEEYLKAPATTLRDICGFLGVKPPSRMPTEREMKPLAHPLADKLIEAYVTRQDEASENREDSKETDSA